MIDLSARSFVFSVNILNKNKIYNNKQKKYFKYIILLNTKQY